MPNSGDFYEGMIVTKETVYDGKGLLPAPRVGFAWDVFGDGKTSVRGGWGIFYDRYQDDIILSLVEQPPLMDTRTTSFTTIPQLQNSQLIQSPRGVTGFAEFEAPTVYNWSIGVQHALPWNMIADVAYVGNAGRNQPVTNQINDLPYGTQLLPQNADPTNGGQPVAANYLRPYRGYGGIGIRDWTGYNDYHSIQVAVNRRFAQGFAFGVSYTGMKRKLLSLYDPFLSEADNKARNYNYSTNAKTRAARTAWSSTTTGSCRGPARSGTTPSAASRSTAGRSPASPSCRVNPATGSATASPAPRPTTCRATAMPAA